MIGIMMLNKAQVMKQAQQMKHPEMRSPASPPKAFSDDPFSEEIGFKMPKHDPYQVKSYGAPTTKLKEQLDAAETQQHNNPAPQRQGFNDYPGNQPSSFNTTYQNIPHLNGLNNLNDDHSPNSISDSYSGTINSAKKKKKKRPKNKTQTRQSQDTSGYASQQSNSNQMMQGFQQNMHGAFDTVPQNRQQMNGQNRMHLNIATGNMNQLHLPNQAMKMPNNPPFQQMTPQKDSRGSDDDPFKGIGFGNFGSSFKAPAFENKMSLFHLDEPQATQSNDFDDPFAEDTFSNMSASKTESQNMFTPQKGSSMAQSVKNAPSTQYNFENSQKKTQNNDNFAFDEINIDLGDLSLFESPMPKINQPPETQMKREMHSGMPLESSRSNFSNQSNPQRNLNMGSFGNPNKSNMGNQRMNSPGFNSQGIRNQNINSFGRTDFSGMGPKEDEFNMFNTTAPVKSTFQNQPPPNQMQRQPPGRPNNPQQMDFFEESKTGRSIQNQSNMMSLNNSQMSAEPQVIQRGGPPQDRQNTNFANNFNTAAPPMRNQPPPQLNSMGSIGGLDNTGSFGGGQQRMLPPNNMNTMSGFNNMPNQNNMLVPVDPFRAADA